MPRTPVERIAFMRREQQHRSRDWTRDCQLLVRLAIGDVPGGSATALIAWNHVDPANKHQGPAPAGWPVFYDYTWRQGEAGHVVLSDGNEGAYTNDAPRTGFVGHVSQLYFPRYWRMRRLGWTTELNGVHLPLPTSRKPDRPIIDLSQLLHDIVTRRSGSASVALIQQALGHGLKADGRWGPKTAAQYASWQRAQGYHGRDADGLPGMVTLSKLGAKHGFAVKA